ncbi:MAG: undecaprenyldiphospho-muramoylpentapeptide beta-N-acetylglucosaminyltransferase, partial [candidate division Zixibacteria bacterium]|nr:undecaprenyldiphospho-muramoylpentapeptide beta-N-acetylglucosaminyltransferase [candidate division Zixibacteria bacterium]
MRQMKVIFAGGGTGGHLFPAIAIAKKLKARLEPEYAADFIFVGTRRGLEYRIKEKLGYPLALINVRGMSRSLSLYNLMVPFLLVAAVVKSLILINKFHPHLVIGTGGYVMGPVILAALIINKPCVIQEQNSYPGLTTRKLASRVDRVFLGFGAAANYLSRKCRAIETGNPVKDAIGKISKVEGRTHFQFNDNGKVILILGGSQGALAINRNILRNLNNLRDGYRVIWQTGERDYKDVAAQAGGKVSSRALFPFTEKIEMAYAAADMIIARAGALTLAEIAAAGLPAILIPYPYAAGDHQRKNAMAFAQNGAAVIFQDEQLDKIDLLSEAVKLLESSCYEKMMVAIKTM